MQKLIIIFLISMVPLVELRAAIPYAQLQGISLMEAYPVAILGNMLPVPFIYLFARRVLIWGQDKRIIGGFFKWCHDKGERAGQKLHAKDGLGVYIALFIFVGIPLPGTGAWTGTLAASFLDLDFKKSSVAVLGGVLLAGIIMALTGAGLLEMFSAIFGGKS